MLRVEKFKERFPDAPDNGTAQKLWETAWNEAIKTTIKHIDIYTTLDQATARAYAMNIMDELEGLA